MRARDLMRRAVATVTPEATVGQVAALMQETGCSGLPVVDDQGRVLRMLTEADLLHLALPEWMEQIGELSFVPEGFEPYAKALAALAQRPLREVLAETSVVVAEEEDPLLEVIRLMAHHGLRRIPVVRDGKLTGILNREDVTAAVFHPGIARAGNQ